MTKREKINKLKAFVRKPHVWPGGYTLVMMAGDGCAICFKCVQKEFKNILDSTKKEIHDGWEFEETFVNWEGENLYCAHCYEKIPSEYGDDED